MRNCLILVYTLVHSSHRAALRLKEGCFVPRLALTNVVPSETSCCWGQPGDEAQCRASPLRIRSGRCFSGRECNQNGSTNVAISQKRLVKSRLVSRSLRRAPLPAPCTDKTGQVGQLRLQTLTREEETFTIYNMHAPDRSFV